MEPIGSAGKSKTKWIIFGAIIAVLAILVLVGPILFAKYMKHKYITKYSKIVRSELMIKVKGVVKLTSDEKSVYLIGENGLFYVLFGEQESELMKNVEKEATVFGNIYEPLKDETIEGNPVRMRINVVNMGFPNLENVQLNQNKS
ncbi:MAG: hypothetical protein FWH43_06505 [Endomicrobia bacterium]|nr:hypothetical protein [Endomicrobiia bacterium]MCL2145123.1 hypothetical protein [Endomicrobiia bacterium]